MPGRLALRPAGRELLRGRRRVAAGNGLVAYFRMNEAGGNIVNLLTSVALTGYNTPGSATGKVYALAREMLLANAEYFGGLCEPMRLLVGPLTVALWEKPYTYSGQANVYRMLVGNAQNVWSGGFDIAHTQDGGLFVHIYPGGGPPHYWLWHTLQIPTLNAWNLVVMTYAADTRLCSVRVNADTRVSNTSTEVLAEGGYFGENTCYFGCANAYDGWFDGLLGPVAVWNRVLSEVDWSALWAGGAGLPYEGFTE
jgi:hypothetical protein